MLNNRTILVTSATHWAGPEICAGLAVEGARVVCQDPNFADKAVADAFVAAHPALTAIAEEKPAEIVASALEVLGHLDVLVNNDAFPAIRAPIETADPQDFRDGIEALLVFPFMMAGAVTPHMKARKAGKILFLTSASALNGLANYSMYAAARAGANGLAKSLARELGKDNIQVNAIASNYIENPDYFPPELLANKEAYAKMVKNIPLGRLGKPQEAAHLVAFYCSDRSDFITGNIMPFSGGWA
ncbi:SDR family oxidoreductase [Iodidimonas sp. SYSU 1G8]|uniref:SDR family oxidoreductase n=1 Tax=Iodidimonas sp. SYSU 1G8 TaxID=3133967 RepID=UPI0031FF3DD6